MLMDRSGTLEGLSLFVFGIESGLMLVKSNAWIGPHDPEYLSATRVHKGTI